MLRAADADAPAKPQAAVPDAAAQAVAEKALREQYRFEYSKKTIIDRLTLAQLLLKKSLASNDAPVKFVMLREARDLASLAGAYHDAMDAIDEMAGAFAVEPLELRYAALAAAAKPPPANPHVASDLLASCGALTEDAVTAENMDLAAKAAALGESVAAATKAPAAVARAKAQTKFLKEATEARAQASASRETLKTTPEDAAANLAAGRWLAAYRGDWAKGLPFLARCSDAQMAQAAKKELADSARGKDMFEVAEQWWAQGERPGFPKIQFRRHAAYWYAKAAAEGIPAPAAATAEKKLQDLAAADTRRSIDLLGIVDASRDAWHGTFKWAGADLVAVRGYDDSIEFPVHLPDDFDYRIEFVRNSGDDAVMQSMPRPPGYFSWVIAGWRNEWAGFEMINEAQANANATSVRFKPMLTNGRKYVSLVQVRHDGVKGFLDGKLVAQWKTDYHDFTARHLPRQAAFPSITIWTSEATISAAELIGISAEPKVGRIVPPAAKQ
ncbi:MAG TPA: hypothetical protein VG269_10845 [Tepidisphaeraceae bacterium]|nr:hypothetical protein [Tepidisphaeraceae bacterium]